MFIARLFISCLFLLSISLQGMAAVQLVQPCPMEQTMMQADMDDRCSMMSAMPQNDCCLDGQSSTHSGPGLQAWSGVPCWAALDHEYATGEFFSGSKSGCPSFF